MQNVDSSIHLPHKRYQFFTFSHVLFGVVHTWRSVVGNFNWEIPISDGKWNAALACGVWRDVMGGRGLSPASFFFRRSISSFSFFISLSRPMVDIPLPEPLRACVDSGIAKKCQWQGGGRRVKHGSAITWIVTWCGRLFVGVTAGGRAESPCCEGTR